MTRCLVKYHDQPILFKRIGTKAVAEVVPISMATHFPDTDDAYTRAQEQWGDTGMQHVAFINLDAPKKAGQLL